MPDQSTVRENTTPPKAALAGIKVLELGMVMQVPLAGQMFGDFGADVIKVERPSPGEILRTLDPLAKQKQAMSCYYAALCRNKRTISLDIKSPSGRDALLNLVDRADVLLHNFRPGVMERLGFGFEALEKRNPRLVYAVGYAFGEAGPMAGMPGQDMLAQAYSGFARSGVADGQPPVVSNTPVVDYMTAQSLVQGVMAALIERQASGRGQKVTTSLLDVAFASQVLEVSSIAMHSERTSWVKQSMTFRTADGWLIVLTLFRDNPLQGMCKAFNVPDFSGEARFSTHELQVENLDEIEARFRPVIAACTTAECVARLSEQDVLCSPVNTLEEAMKAEQIRHNGMIWEVPVPGYGQMPLAGNPVKLSRTPTVLAQAPTPLGHHSLAVLGEFGFSDEEARKMKELGAVYVEDVVEAG
ncbi:CaiB/BaiF CoA transferase family protein [Oceaniradius stylonematis]|uniref:CaiB/BaiF CoA transferase family protein n=1 Tax=Oceaniradius stylonematis TaxID=2184161 RepID=UPI00273D4193|nr:CaiB/BaiF CoA-transferase family protein [Oceaniradius stylonematis]